LSLPMADVSRGEFLRKAPLISTSKLTSTERGGVGKELSEGYALNFAVGCTHGCSFCYVDRIVSLGPHRGRPEIQSNKWGDYLLVHNDLGMAIEETKWAKWAGKEVMMSSTHDPYLPDLNNKVPWARRILEAALPAGVRFCIQTRSLLVLRDLDLLARYRDQVRLQVSIMTMSRKLARAVEPRVPAPERRLEVLRKAKAAGIPTGVILAPIFPGVRLRPYWSQDLEELVDEISAIRPDHIYGESLHIRGKNIDLVNEALGEKLDVDALRDFDRVAEQLFDSRLQRHGLKGTWWPEYHQNDPSQRSLLADVSAP
jgi:DNA repair photolyase